MSLACLAIRASTALALRNATWAEDRVYESRIEPIEALVQDEPLPFITVSIDEASGDKPDLPVSLLSAIDSVLLVIEIAIARQQAVTGENGATETLVTMPQADRGLDWSLDLITRQVMRALSSDGTWAELWRRLRLRINKVSAIRGAAADGVRFAARQIVVDLHPIADPDLGGLPVADPDDSEAPVWTAFLAALRGLDGSDPDLAEYVDLADVIEAELKTPAGLGTWQIAKARLGASLAGTAALGITPHELVMPDPVPALTFTVEVLDDAVDEPRADAFENSNESLE